ncbi:hypothetical protein [Phyllobacterium endophyticum]|uniref:hypothetical protein n=1 Tax=Phyllobacterium endophyticum TaxID=1149773 RepID=UPI0011CBA58C|nr:hypothetical protein [Phyllobacterium endophyticum]TXR48423.1 hypothetical protein FVA77_15310 [Phyllobacterium endophyticum]
MTRTPDPIITNDVYLLHFDRPERSTIDASWGYRGALAADGGWMLTKRLTTTVGVHAWRQADRRASRSALDTTVDAKGYTELLTMRPKELAVI